MVRGYTIPVMGILDLVMTLKFQHLQSDCRVSHEFRVLYFLLKVLLF